MGFLWIAPTPTAPAAGVARPASARGGALRATGVDRSDEPGPFDVVGPVAGCLDELTELLKVLGYRIRRDPLGWDISHPGGRRLVFTGDLLVNGVTDIDDRAMSVLELVRDVVGDGTAFYARNTRDVAPIPRLYTVARDTRDTRDGPTDAPTSSHHSAARFLESTPDQLVLDAGRLVIHPGAVPEPLALTDDVLVVLGTGPHETALWGPGWVDLDTGCASGGHLTALRFPERTTVAVAARQPARPVARQPARHSVHQIRD